MEATVLSVGKSVLDGALSYAKSAVVEEVALQLGVQRDQAFIREELDMMMSFLMAAHEERGEDKVLKTWVKQVRDVAYDVEDCLQDFAVHLKKPSRWRIPRTLRERRRIAKQMKELRARVEDVSQRNLRYHLTNGSTSKPATAAAQSISRASATMFGIDEARRFAKQDKPKVDLLQLINKEDKDLRVIAVWGTGGDVGLTSIIRKAYENPNIKGKFPCRAWVRVMHPFNPKVFVQSLVKQFNAPVGVDVMLETEKTERDLAQEFNRYVNEESFLIVLNDLSTIEEWDQIKTCFVSNKKGSRIIVSTAQVEVASLCAGQESIVSELKELSADQTLYVFYKKVEEVPISGNVESVIVAPAANEERAIVVYKPADAAQPPAWPAPTGCSSPRQLRMDHGVKNTMVQEASEHRVLFEELARDESSIPAMVPWAPPQSQAASTASLTVAEIMEAEDREGMSMKVEQDRCDQLANAGPAQGEALHQLPQHRMGSTEAGSSSDATTSGSNSSAARKSLTRMETTVAAFKESELVGRVDQKAEVIELILKDSQRREVISVLGMGGLGKTTLVRSIYGSEELSGKFDKRACVTIERPFDPKDLRRSLAMHLNAESSKNKEAMDFVGRKTKFEDDQALFDLLKGKKYLIVLDDLTSVTEWDAIEEYFPKTEAASRIIVTTREEKIAKHCSVKKENIYRLPFIEEKDAKDLFTKKVFINETVDLDKQYPDLAEEAKPILSKCRGLPLAIVTIGGFLAKQPKTVVEWRKLNGHISAELQMNPELGPIKTVLEKSYNGLPYHLKSCFLYLSIFPEDQAVSRKRLVRRWTAEGYSREVHDKSAEEVADGYFMELKERSMILPAQKSIHSTKGIDSCQVHDLMRDISISKSKEECLVFRLEEGCNVNTQGTIRHLAITSRSWEGDKSEFENTVDMSRIRSLTVFGEWRTFFISDKMRLLRVLDLEDAEDICDHHLEHIGKLIHLKYLSLRGCYNIFHLTDSLGNLRQLETLDIRDTQIIKLPKSIIKLRKLNYLRAGNIPADEDVSYEEFIGVAPKLIRRNRLCHLTVVSVMLCAYCSAAPVSDLGGMSSRDVCTVCCCVALPAIAMRLDMQGVAVPRGMRKLKTLHTLGVVNVARGRAVLQEIKSLTQLRKLGVTGINKKNGQEFCAAFAALSRLESLSVRSEGEPGLSGCLSTAEPPKKLQSLKLYGNLVKLPEWIKELKNLVKLKLRSTRLSEHDVAMQVLGNLSNLANLGLWSKSFQGEVLCFPKEGFRSLELLNLQLEDIKSIKFDQGAMPKLELLHVWGSVRQNVLDFSGLEFLPSIKEVQLNVWFAGNIDWSEVHRSKNRDERIDEVRKEAALKQDKLNNHVRDLLAKNPKQPILKVD